MDGTCPSSSVPFPSHFKFFLPIFLNPLELPAEGQRAHSIDYFVSHDWQTGRWQKTLSLLLIFNSLPAAFAAVLVSFVTSGLLLLERLPGGWWTASLLTYVVYFCFLCFWQRIRRALCCSVPLVFVDRLCIAQGDPGLKNQGILGLAGFLSKSKRLLVLWSPNTFTRLWCTFELASFMRDMDRQKSIVLIPVPMASLLWIACGTTVLLAFAWHAVFVFEERFTIASGPSGSPLFRGIVALFMLPAVLIGLPLQSYLGIRHMTEFLSLKEQLHNFSVRASQCACCTLNHVDPQTADPMTCDRELVFRTLKRWSPGCSVCNFSFFIQSFEMDAWMDARTDGRTDGRMDGWMDIVWVKSPVCIRLSGMLYRMVQSIIWTASTK